jgi:hypothetical protein
MLDDEEGGVVHEAAFEVLGGANLVRLIGGDSNYQY